MTGLVAAVEGERVTVFDPGARRQVTVAGAEVTPLPAGAVTVTVTVDLPLAHGLDEDELRRWVASLLDPVVRERAAEALLVAGLDQGAALPPVRLDVLAAQTSGAICLCGARTPAASGAAVACMACGRQAVARPQPARGDLLGL